jgi:hypothetical protein
MTHTYSNHCSRVVSILASVVIALAVPLFGQNNPAPYTVAPTDRTPRPQLGNYGTNTDGAWHDSGPQVNKPFNNIFGLREVRVTDGMIPGGAFIGDGWQGPATWWANYFSVYDPTFGGYWFYIPLDNGQGDHLFKLNPSSMTVTPLCGKWQNCTMPYAAEWSYVTPGLMYFGSGSQVQSYNYDTNKGPNTVYDFAQCPGIAQYQQDGIGVWDISVSHDDSVVKAVIGDSMLAIFNRTTEKCYWISSQYGMVGGTDFPEATPASMQPWPNLPAYSPSGFTLHDGWMSSNGNWGVIVPECDAAGCPPAFNVIWQVHDSSGNETNKTTLCTIFGGCEGHIALGQNKAFYVISAPKTTGVSAPPHYDFGTFPLASPTGGTYTSGSYTRLHPTGPPYFNDYAPDTECNVSDTHPSWNTSDTQPIIESSFVDQLVPGFSLMQINCAWDHEIDAVASDGSGTTWRLAHNRASGLANQLSDPESSYNALSMPVCTSDGKYCMWATDWNGALGTQTANTTVGGYYCHIDCSWHPHNYYNRGQEILGGWGNEQVAIQAGTTGGSYPSLAGYSGGITHDGGVIWENQPGCNTSESLHVSAGGNTLGKGLCRTDVFIVEAK